MDYIGVNYYRTMCASYLPADEEHPAGLRTFRGNEVDFDQYGYLRDEMNENLEASEYGARIDPMGYSLWSFLDVLSSHQGFKKRFGMVYVNRGEMDLKDLRRIKKDSFTWYQKVIKTNGEDLEE